MTGIIITLIICATILCIFGMACALNHKQKKNSKAIVNKFMDELFDKEED